METKQNIDRQTMTTECQHTKTTLQENIGYDIDPSGEENQHLETCLECGMSRLVVDRLTFGGEAKRIEGLWQKPDTYPLC